MPNIYISHSQSDNEISKIISDKLENDSAEVWIDYFSANEDAIKRTGHAIVWCDVFLLVWSESAAESRFVDWEWTEAVENNTQIIICLLDNTSLPNALTALPYINFKNINNGYVNLKSILQLKNSEENQPAKENTFRTEPVVLSKSDVKTFLEKHNFFDEYKNKEGREFNNIFELKEINGEQIVYDLASNLIWQQSGSYRCIKSENVRQWIKKLNVKNYAGYNDWRLPTLEEAMSLINKTATFNDLYIHSIFDKKQKMIWTADKVENKSWPWIVAFNNGSCSNFGTGYSVHIRSVRSADIECG